MLKSLVLLALGLLSSCPLETVARFRGPLESDTPLLSAAPGPGLDETILRQPGAAGRLPDVGLVLRPLLEPGGSGSGGWLSARLSIDL